MKELVISEIHKKTLDLFKELDAICKTLNINCFIAYGTLIGAVRHKGFIPWDDDFDVIMLREDFDKFVNYCHKNIDTDKSSYKLLDYTNTTNYPYTIPRFCDLNYKVVSNDYPNLEMGLFIDIYPFDGVGNRNNYSFIKKIEIKKTFYIHCLHYSITKQFEHRNRIYKEIILFFIYSYSKKKESAYFRNKLLSLKDLYGLESSKYIGCVVWDFKLKPIEKWHYEQYEILNFEGIKVKVPIGYNEVLKNSYGDYMKFPPIEEQKASHNYRIYSKENDDK